MVLVGPLSVEAAGVPVDAADVEVQPQLGEFFREPAVDLPPQLQSGLVEVLEVFLLVGLEPGAVVVEADAPHEIQSLAGVALKHIRVLRRKVVF